MKSKEEIEQLAIEHAHLKPNFDRVEEEYYNIGAINAYESFIRGYTQCQKDNDWTKNCKCESSIGQTWCCNQCGLPYDTSKSDKKYTEEDLRQAIERTYRYVDNKGWSLDIIPITEDILLKCGFVEDGDYFKKGVLDMFYCLKYYKHLNGYYFYIQYSDSPFEWDDNTFYPISCTYKYLHQLQNLYFCLTRTELEIKL